VLKTAARALVAVAIVLSTAACGYDASATFNPDGSVAVGLKFLFPRSLMNGSNGTSVSGFTPSDIASANAQLQKQYPGSKVTAVSEGDESGALITIPFKNEKDAFAFLTKPSALKPPAAQSPGSSLGLNLGNTGGMFTSATHTSSGGGDTYTFKTAAATTQPSSAGSQQGLTDDEVQAIFTITFAVTLPHAITSAPGALFTLDRKTAIWNLRWTKAETLTATTGADAALAGNVSPLQDARLLIAVGFIAVAVGFLLGMFLAWRGRLPHRQPAGAVAAQTVPVDQPSAAPPGTETQTAWPGPPPQAPPPTEV